MFNLWSKTFISVWVLAASLPLIGALKKRDNYNENSI